MLIKNRKSNRKMLAAMNYSLTLILWANRTWQTKSTILSCHDYRIDLKIKEAFWSLGDLLTGILGAALDQGNLRLGNKADTGTDLVWGPTGTLLRTLTEPIKLT